jgi:hypothetical protein
MDEALDRGPCPGWGTPVVAVFSREIFSSEAGSVRLEQQVKNALFHSMANRDKISPPFCIAKKRCP